MSMSSYRLLFLDADPIGVEEEAQELPIPPQTGASASAPPSLSAFASLPNLAHCAFALTAPPTAAPSARERALSGKRPPPQDEVENQHQK